jgi:hypothetical protein
LEIDAPAGAEARTDHCGRPSYRRKNSRVTEFAASQQILLDLRSIARDINVVRRTNARASDFLSFTRE